MEKNTRFVLIDCKKKTPTVLEKTVPLVTYNIEAPIDAKDVEWARTQEYNSKA